MQKTWEYRVYVREGAPGYADDDSYYSEKFDSFKCFYHSYSSFNPYKHWYHLRHVQSEILIYVDENGDEHRSKLYKGNMVLDNGVWDEQTYGISETEVDNIRLNGQKMENFEYQVCRY